MTPVVPDRSFASSVLDRPDALDDALVLFIGSLSGSINPAVSVGP